MNTTESRHSFQGRPIGAGRTQHATDVGVVVVSFASARTIRYCLELLLSAESVVRIVVVDNASVDGTADLVADMVQRHERVTLVRNGENRGFAAACNQGASALATPWVCFVNPDCYVPGEGMDRLVQHGVTRAGAGLLGVDIVDEQGLPERHQERQKRDKGDNT